MNKTCLQEWIEIIRDVLSREPDVISGRGGETPLSNLAVEFKQLSKEEYALTRMIIVEAFEKIINDPSSVNETFEWWKWITQLILRLPGKEKSRLGDIFYIRIYGEGEDSPLRLIGFFVHGFISSGGRFSYNDIQSNALIFIKGKSPLNWLGAVVYSGFFKLAEEETCKLISENKIDINRFLYGLDTWQELWPSKEGFKEVVIAFRNSIPVNNKNEIEKFNRWLSRRDFI